MPSWVNAGIAVAAALCAVNAACAQEGAAQGSGGLLRVLDRTIGRSEDVTISIGETIEIGLLQVQLHDCRYPVDNPSGDAFAQVSVRYGEEHLPVFDGWMIASSPAINPVDHPRYDLWPLSCIRS